jgi:ketosteroid isomerase-like protein
MSEENVEVMAAAIEVLNARDATAVDALFDEEVEWRPARSAGGAVEGAVYRGKKGMVQYIEDVDSGFDEVLFDIQSIDSVDADRVFYRGRMIARGSASGIPLDVPIWGLWTVQGGKLIRGEGFLSEKEALETAGLSE